MKKKDWILIGILFGIIGVFLIFNKTFFKEENNIVVVSVQNKKYGAYLLEENQDIKIDNHNIIRIEDNQVYMKQADCLDQTCVKQGPISSNGESIICLPHKLVVTVEGD